MPNLPNLQASIPVNNHRKEASDPLLLQRRMYSLSSNYDDNTRFYAYGGDLFDIEQAINVAQ